jgi:hypothetical protein
MGLFFRQHRIRVANYSESNLKKIEQEMNNHCNENKKDCPQALEITDWEMKFNTESARQTTEEHFGKRGIYSWHYGGIDNISSVYEPHGCSACLLH